MGQDIPGGGSPGKQQVEDHRQYKNKVDVSPGGETWNQVADYSQSTKPSHS